ncbi:MAG: deoxyribose-phosphate aldolase [Deltaproteobacteria bacterium]|nr:deoxyribose-phosphate aldolase [Deltaproteobacteria bacterium]
MTILPTGLAGKIDLTLLKPDATRKDVEGFIRKALAYPFATVCVPPSYVFLASSLLKGSRLKVSTVVGFPLGYQTTKVKAFEAKEAVEHGGAEIDMVMNISAFKSGDFQAVEEEIAAIVAEAPLAAVKVIIEACCLTDEEKVKALDIAVNAGARFVKTSTGFAFGGATINDVRLLKDAAQGRIQIKAAGGIKTLGAALDMISAGADRIGTSSGVEIVEEFLKPSRTVS